jgi:CubicO group peptidase (beta-lactamase class C family)
MKRRHWIGIGGVAVLAAGFVLASGGHPLRVLIGTVSGADALAYLPPRREVPLVAGPPQPTLSLLEAGIDAESIEVAMHYAETRNTTALVVGLNGHIVYAKFWGNGWGDTPLDTDVDLSGFTPVLSALVLGTALQNGEIRDLDSPLSIYFKEWANDPRGTITLRDLLTGNSNLAAPGARTWPRSLAANYYAGDDLGAHLRSWPLAEKADPAGSPAAVDADVLSAALTLALKADYAQLLKDRLWQPMEAGGFSVGIDGDQSSAGHVRAGCCLRARLGDWMRVGALIANRGVFEGNQFAPPDYAKLLLTPTHRDSPRAVFLRVDGQFAAHDVVRLEADGKQRLWMVPSLKLVILRTGGEPPSDQGWDEAMIPDNIIRGTHGWQPASTGEGAKVDPNLYAPHR